MVEIKKNKLFILSFLGKSTVFNFCALEPIKQNHCEDPNLGK